MSPSESAVCFFFHSVERLSSLPRGPRTLSLFHCGGFFSCPTGTRLSGRGRPCGLWPSAPSAVIPPLAGQGRPAVGTPRCSHETAPATPRRETPARPHAQAGWRAGLEAQPERPLQAHGANKNPSTEWKRRAAPTQ
jgi:hypothetical protein